MQVTVRPSILQGTIQAPASKSSMQRACAAALVRQAKTVIQNPGHSNDDQAALGIIKAFGCTWAIVNGDLIVDSSKTHLSSGDRKPTTEINCGESGLSIRMFTPIAALSYGTVVINGSGSLATRPMDFFDKILPQLGVDIMSNNGKLPLKIQGPLQPKNIEVDGSLSSQFLTGLLFAYAAADANDVTIKVNNLQSKPYIDLTLKVMRDFGMNVPENKDYQEFRFVRTAQLPAPPLVSYIVEGDWSGGAFLLVAGAIAGNIVVKGLDINSTQADRKIIEALRDAEAKMDILDTEIHLEKSTLKAFYFDATDCPDLFPPLVALAAYCDGVTIIKGVKRLTHKESNRALTLQQEFGKMGLRIELDDDAMYVHGGKLTGTTVYSHHDHRIAMACTVAALPAEGETMIEQADAINKSYPDFYGHLLLLGAVVKSNKLINL